jgi:hypothetical protein
VGDDRKEETTWMRINDVPVSVEFSSSLQATVAGFSALTMAIVVL